MKIETPTKDALKVIRLLGNRSVYHVNIDEFIKVSLLVKQQQNAGNLMTSVDLHRFSDQSILAFVNYIQSKEIKNSLTYYAIAELITLANTFHMTDFKKDLEENLMPAARISPADLLQTLIICDVSSVSIETEKALQQIGVEQIEKLAELPDFHKLPYGQLYQILTNCEISVPHEMFIADVALLWLNSQTHISQFVPGLFSCIRAKYLTPIDKTLIVERINMLCMSSKIVRFVRNYLESPGGQRVCMEPNHLKKNLPRCGPMTTMISASTYSSLPLSKPNFSIKIKKPLKSEKNKEQSKKSKKKKVVNQTSNAHVMDLIEMESAALKSAKPRRKKKVKKTRRCACIEFIKNSCAS
ncbi:unnamed protein product [Caenorhabditis bovis]|uniref:BACK domain-containing protein n=1 Tax=Caenorhabditis bovis TaxID=2654633 RepID=A0A8S1EBZ4_9PELO|nr:unnamed protein product [Caenorhabditis bovis]